MTKPKTDTNKNGEEEEVNDSFTDFDPDTVITEQTVRLKEVKQMLTRLQSDSAARKTKRIYYNTKFQQLNQLVSGFELGHRKLVRGLPHSKHQDYTYFSADMFTQFDEAHLEYVIALQTAHDTVFPEEPNPRQTPANDPHVAASVKLPTIDIPKFAGAQADWKSFHDLFRSIIHTNAKLPNSHKFQYLIGALSGEPRDLVSTFDACDDDYPKAWKLLTETYNDKSKAFTHIMNKFSALKPLTAEIPDQLRAAIKETSSCFQSLASIDIEREKIDPIITYLLVRKLPKATISHWEQHRDRKNLPLFNELKECIETRIRVAAAVASFQSSTPNNQSAEPKAENKNFKSNKEQKKKTFTANHSSVQNPKPSAAAGTSSSPSNQSPKSYPCPACHTEGHPIRTCEKFLSLSVNERRNIVNKNHYCVNCLAYNHTESKCHSPRTCFTCGDRHHSLLHPSNSAESVVRASHHTLLSATTPSSIHQINACNTQSNVSNQVLLATAIINILDVDGESHSFRALIDQGSEASFITESAAQTLRLPRSSVRAVINGIGASNGQSKHLVTFPIQSQSNKNFQITIEALVMGKITNSLPSSIIQPQRWDHLTDLTLADPSYHRTGRIDLVLGSDVFSQIIMNGVRIGPAGSPIAQQTQLGWILSGKIQSPDAAPRVTISAFHSSIETLMENFLSVESIADVNPMTAEEQWCEKFFTDTHRRDETGRFVVRLPFRSLTDPSATLGRSRDIAVKRLIQLERRFAHDANLKTEYAKSINEHLTSGRMQLTTSTDLLQTDGTCASAYLPHHAVIKESSTSTKLRVVFDASRKTTNGRSLNDVLIVGPTIQSDLVSILINWRFHRIAFTADIQKMYLQVKVDQRDIEYQRILWRDDPSEPIHDYSLNRLTFGTSCAPYIAIKSIRHLAESERKKYPEAAEIMINDAYVDDVISGGDDIRTVQKLQKNLAEMMRLGGFELKKWTSNNNEVLQQIPEADREIKIPVELNADESIKALGLAWNTANDSFSFKLTMDNTEKITKRSVLSTVAKLFDPVGLIAPIIVVGKIFMKNIWAAVPVLDWDDPLPPSLCNSWTEYVNNLQHLTEIKIPRWINTARKPKSTQLHGFCDASASAYGAAIYIRTIDENDHIHSHIISSKSKVAPKKALTIPRLELCAAHLLAKLLVAIRSCLRHSSIAASDITLWGDSEIVWHWLRSEKPLKVFVENRVTKINELTTGIRWRHVNTKQNPADLVSRGTSPLELAKSELWWHGPSWLLSPEDTWPLSRVEAANPPPEVEIEYRRVVQANLCATHTDIIDRFSSYLRLLRVTAWMKRFINNIRAKKTKQNKLTSELTVDELQWTRRHWIRQVQNQHYHDEIHQLTQASPIDTRSKLLSLHPFIDGNGLIRVQGRLDNSTLSYDQKHPIILPPNHHFSSLLIDHLHRLTKHGGAQLVVSLLHKEYWMINARNTVRLRIHKCITCFRHRAATSTQLMGSLPPARVRRQHRPFLHTGVDYCGPIELRASKGRGIKSYKGYVAVFICLTVKAVHIECVDGLTTDAFLAAFHRFVSRRGLPSNMYSDNGTNFVGAAKEINQMHQTSIQQSEKHVAETYTERQINWHFIPPGSPHFGGLWEANVKSFKHHFRRIIGDTKLTYEELHTLTAQIEACMNSRPLGALTSDVTDMTSLTPGHFCVGSELLAIPERSQLEVNPNHLSRWHQLQQMKQLFWIRWRNDYLSQLQQRPKWCREKTNLQIGELVLVKHDQMPSFRWPLGRIIQIHPGADNLTRVVTVQTASGTYTRNVTKISRLPIAYEQETEDETTVANSTEGC